MEKMDGAGIYFALSEFFFHIYQRSANHAQTAATLPSVSKINIMKTKHVSASTNISNKCT